MAVFEQTAHPVIRRISAGQLVALGPERAQEELVKREQAIALMSEIPLRYGYEPDIWKRVDESVARRRAAHPGKVIWTLIMGGNRAGKSEYAAKRVMELMLAKDGARVWCLHSTESASRQSQMPLLWKYLPPEWRPTQTGRMRKGVMTKITYSQATGFSDNTFVLPNGSQCWFKFYGADVTTVEGVELDMAWADELVPLDWVDALRFRLVTRGGHGLVTFTPIEGVTPTVQHFTDGVVTREKAPAELLPVLDASGKVAGHEAVPVRQVCERDDRREVWYFHTRDNPFGNYEALAQEVKGQGRDFILTRAYGVPRKVREARFPKFDEVVHVLPREKVEGEVLKDPGKLTWYHVVDPCAGRNFFMLWAAVDARGRITVAREWPQPDDYIPGIGFPGSWAVLSTGKKLDGDRGEAQQPWGLGLLEIAREVERVERELAGGTERDGTRIEVHQRIMDSRFGNTPTLSKSEGTTLIQEMQEVDLHFIPASGEHQNEGVQLVNDLLAWDRERPLSTLNEPRLYVSARCENVIFSLKNWTGADGLHGACKDPVDCLRYLALAEPEWLGGDKMKVYGGGYY